MARSNPQKMTFQMTLKHFFTYVDKANGHMSSENAQKLQKKLEFLQELADGNNQDYN